MVPEAGGDLSGRAEAEAADKTAKVHQRDREKEKAYSDRVLMYACRKLHEFFLSHYASPSSSSLSSSTSSTLSSSSIFWQKVKWLRFVPVRFRTRVCVVNHTEVAAAADHHLCFTLMPVLHASQVPPQVSAENNHSLAFSMSLL